MRVCRSALALCLMAVVSTAYAADDRIARWTDASGITHFGDPGSAPVGAAEVAVAPTNGMDVPQGAPESRSSNGPVWTVIDQAPKSNKVGWRAKGQRTNSGPISPSQR